MCEAFQVEDLALMIRATRGRSMDPWIHGSAAGAPATAAASSPPGPYTWELSEPFSNLSFLIGLSVLSWS